MIICDCGYVAFKVTFKMLPPHAVDNRIKTNNDRTALNGSASPFVIMLVDDEEDILNIVQKYLQKWGFVVEAFSDSIVALEHFKAKPDYYHLLLTDIRIPGMTGIELASRITETKPGVPIVFMTAYETDGVELPVTTAAAGSTNIIKRDDIVKKPFRLVEICTAVKKQLIRD